METSQKKPVSGIAVLVVRDGKILLGLLAKEWWLNGQPTFGIPGRDIAFGETIGDAAARVVREDIGCGIESHSVFCVNANYEFGNHYIVTGVVAKISGDVQNLHPEDWETWAWYGLDELPENLFPSAKNAIVCYRNSTVCEVE